MMPDDGFGVETYIKNPLVQAACRDCHKMATHFERLLSIRDGLKGRRLHVGATVDRNDSGDVL